MSFEPVTPSQAEQHRAWKEARARLRAPETMLRPRLVISHPGHVQTKDEVRRELMDFAIAAVGNVAGLPVTEVLAGVPTVEICNARNLAMAVCACRHKLSVSHIADYFGVHQRAVTNAAKSLNYILIDFSISTRTPLELILPTIWPRWIALLQATSVRDIQDAVCDKWGISRTDILSDRRELKFVVPRQAAMVLSRHLTKNSMMEIGRKFEKDHTTILHATRKFEARMAEVISRIPPLSPVLMWVNCLYERVQENPFPINYGGASKSK